MKTYKVNRIKNNKLIISGKGEHPLWNKAEILTDFVSPWDTYEVKKIEFKSLSDDENLFFCFIVHDNKIYLNNNKDKITSINNSDRVELFFRSNKKLDPYYCLEIDTTSRIMDFKAYPNKKFDFNWNWSKKDIKVKSDIKKNQFSVEGKISIKSLKRLQLIKNNKIEAGIFRAKYKKMENSIFEPTWISWVNPNTETPNFHTASAFGVFHIL
jgi:hypothetical protein